MERLFLVLPFPETFTIVGFADNLTLVVGAKNPEDVEDYANWIQKPGRGFSTRCYSNSHACDTELERILCY